MGVRSTKQGWQVYSGSTRRLVIAIDIGTTFSGASYCILNPGEKPKIVDVGAFPDQNGGHCKTSSSVLYAPDGSLIAIGNEVNSEKLKHLAAATGAIEARWWKLGLGSKVCFDEERDSPREKAQSSATQFSGRHSIVIPTNKNPEDIFADYLAWIVGHVEKFISAHHQRGSQLVEETRSNRLLVLTHPNGWEGKQQGIMRKACIRARVVSDVNRASTLVKFVSEAEASMTYALMCNTMSTWNEVGSQIAIVDAGGGTIDLTAYRIDSTVPYNSVSEICIPQCMFEGSVTVDNRAKELLKQKLYGTRWDNEEDLDTFLVEFIRTIKHTFTTDRIPCLLKIGSNIDCDERIGLSKGMLVFQGYEIAALFQDAVRATINGLRNIFAGYGQNQEKRVAFVGGFSENVYFRESISKALGHDVIFAKPDNATAKAVANGAVAWAIEGVVQVRKAKMWYGIRCAIPLDRRKKSHIDRLQTKFQTADGQTRLPDAFQVICEKGDEVMAEKDIKASFSMTREINEDLHGSFDLIVYRGDKQPPDFIEVENPAVETLCTMDVNLERLHHALPIKVQHGKRFRIARFEIHVTLCETELTARWVWNEQCISHSGIAETVYLDDLEFFTRKASHSAAVNASKLNRNDPEDARLSTRCSYMDDDPNDDVSTINSLTGSSGFDDLTSDQLSTLIRNLELKRLQKQQSHSQQEQLHNMHNQTDEEVKIDCTLSPSTPAIDLRPTTLDAARQSRRQAPPVPVRNTRETNVSPSLSAAQQLVNIGHTSALTRMMRADTSNEKVNGTELLSSSFPPNPPPPPYDLDAEAESER